jgi:hypothetical protein
MSLEAMTWVFRHSTAEGGARLVLLALADTAHDDGSETYPSVDTLAMKSRLSRRAVQYALRKLEADGHIEQDGFSRRGTTIYRIVMGGGAKSAPVQDATPEGRNLRHEGAQPTAPEPKEPSVEPSTSLSSQRTAKTNSENGNVQALPLDEQLKDQSCGREGEIVADEILNRTQPVKFNGRAVSQLLVEDAVAALAHYCERTGQRLRSFDGQGRPTESLKRIIGAMTAHPEARVVFRRMIDHTLLAPWWEGDPSIGVIFGPRVVEASLQRAQDRPMPGANMRLTPTGQALRALRLAAGEGVG